LGIAATAQIGANVNYLFEAFFFSTPLAALGLQRLQEEGTSRSGWALGIIVTGLIFGGWVLPRAEEPVKTLQRGRDSDRIRRALQTWNELAAVLRDRRVFTTVPRVVLLIKEPMITEPFVHAVWEKVGRRDTSDIADGITSASYEIVVTSRQRLAWRGLDFVTPSIAGAIANTYQPVCSMLDVTIHLPRATRDTPTDQSLTRALRNAGCGGSYEPSR
jgi:hypothetical protein